MDRLVVRAGMGGEMIKGYERSVEGHLAVADAVATGLADAGIGVRSAAEARGLGFVSLGQERYDFVIPESLHGPAYGTGLHRDAEAALPPTAGRGAGRLRRFADGGAGDGLTDSTQVAYSTFQREGE